MTEIIPAEEVPHSKFSPSGSSRWLNCPGSIKLEEKLNIEQGPSIYALEGTAAHELASLCLTNSSDAKKYLDHEIMGFTVDHEMANAVQVYLDFVRQHRYFESLFIVEETLDLSFIYEGMKGTGDCIIENPDELHVFDYKHGKGVPVEAHEVLEGGGTGPNTQLGIYAIGQLNNIFLKRRSLDHIKEVHLHIIQPRCPHPEGPVRSFKTTVEELKKLSQRVREKIADACSDDPTFEPGEKQCKWCPAAPICKHLADYNLSLAKLEFADLQTPGTQAPDANSFSPDELAVILKNSKMIESWLKAVSTYALNELRTHHAIPGFKLVRKRANRVWRDQEAAQNFLQQNMDIEEDDLWKKKFVSPAQAEQLVGRSNKEELQFLITKPLGDITIAGEDDPRPPANPSDGAVSDFSQFIEGNGDE